MIGYIVDLVRATREHTALSVGASPRAAGALAVATRAFAAMQGRDFAIPDDTKQLAIPALRHRVVLAPGAEIDGTTAAHVVSTLVDQVPAPR
jgi:MoxR-like ATPase